MLIQKKPEHYLAVSVSYKSDLWNLLEFIEYHCIVGVSHFFICNNDENPAQSSKILEPYVEEGVVTNIHTADRFQGHPNRQQAAHNLCLRLAGQKARWLAMLDMDEFIYPIISDSAADVMKQYEDCDSVAFHYACFGSSGYSYRPFMQTDAYVHRAIDAWTWNRLCKAIGQVGRVRNVTHHHFFEKNGMVDENKIPCGWVKPYKGNVMRINHYLSRSAEDYEEKMKRGNPIGERRDWNWFHWADRNEVFDDGMRHRFVDRLKNALLAKVPLLRKSRMHVPLL
jgi:hypothetical protein